MADITKTTKQLILVAGFADGDDRTISLDNPKSDITAEQINALKDRGIITIVGDKNRAKFTGWKDARLVESTVTTLDLASA